MSEDEEAADAADEETEAQTEEPETEAEADEQAADEEDTQELVSQDSIEEQLDDAEAELEAAETEADLDAVEAKLDKIEGMLEAADLPEPEDEDEDVESPREQYEARLADLRDELEAARGPYAEDVVEIVSDAGTTVEEERWTERGKAQLEETTVEFVSQVEEILDTDLAVNVTTDTDDVVAALEDAAVAIGEAGLDPDDDAETIEELLAAAEELEAGVEEAETWEDLSTREQLQAEGFFDVLDHRKDYPPEWHALKIWEKRDRVDMVLLALEKLQSNFMEEHCVEALERMGNSESLDAMKQRAQRRDKPAIHIIGKIGDEDGLDAILDYIDADPGMAKPVLKAIGEIGSEETTQDVANQLVADDASVRSQAARSLGLIGDTRAIEPLADTLADDESGEVRASAAWALNQIGTERALEAVRPYSDDRDFLVQSEAEKAVENDVETVA
ncbi:MULTISPECIES: HEAT repeat domain-containing protein [Halorussus]|uniref:HEAT repeat domain-containing protein n=1 Tax=Halorussus TaxID=1070314 RepID=UPI0020A0F722|nr:HEAT repeat domain-containing protein [Halorussus vallis]USZ75531.1 HEAT repeat domain-containing protein [Halorussus vallis]